MRKTLFSANAITLLRISGTAVLLFLRPFSPAFFVVYTLTGVTDVLDGFVARKTGTASDFGAKLDSAADLLFYGVMLLKIFPVLSVILLHRLPPLHFRAVPWLSKCCAALCSHSSMPTMCAPPIPAETVHAVLCITMC